MARYLYIIISKMFNYLTKLKTKGGDFFPSISLMCCVIFNHVNKIKETKNVNKIN